MKTYYTEESEFEIALPPPLDKPMGKIYPKHLTDESGATYGETIRARDLMVAINELIERHNALLEVVKRLAMK